MWDYATICCLLAGSDPNAVYRWSILRNVICATSLFKQAGVAHRAGMLINVNYLNIKISSRYIEDVMGNLHI